MPRVKLLKAKKRTWLLTSYTASVHLIIKKLMSAISQINLNHLTLMALIMRYIDSLLSQTTEGVIPELSTSVFSLEFPLFYSGLALKKGDKQLKTSFLIPLPSIKIVWKNQTCICKRSAILFTNYSLQNWGQTVRMRISDVSRHPAPEPGPSPILQEKYKQDSSLM